MAFRLGGVLRKRYNTFLGDIYTPDIVYAQSTDYDRTKMTALLVLAGLFPPSKSQTWNEKIPWLPIPLAYEKKKNDYIFKRPNEHCPTYTKELNSVVNSKQVLAELSAKQEILDYLSNKTGKRIATFSNLLDLYQTLTAETFMNFSLPEWTKSVYPEVIRDMAIRQCQLETSTPTLKKLFGGRVLQQIVKQIVEKSTNSLKPSTRKIFLYSGHEHTVFSPFAALDLYDHHFPNYASATIYELHKLEDNNYAVKILYQRELEKEPEVKQLKGCDILCPLDKFIEISKLIIPKNYTEECQSGIRLD